ncbi:hypothetical protein M422DRAFT_247435 [Sphaerobolus stellatus SS14]|nr:hypothetical protein M422DRAFT_247435 [Sphaerobolus stellatus SS14]
MARANHPGNPITQRHLLYWTWKIFQQKLHRDAYPGEEPLEFGPTRPFQPASRPLQSHGSNSPSVPRISPESTPNGLAPPPRHPSTVARPASVSSSVTSSIQSRDSVFHTTLLQVLL